MSSVISPVASRRSPAVARDPAEMISSSSQSGAGWSVPVSSYLPSVRTDGGMSTYRSRHRTENWPAVSPGLAGWGTRTVRAPTLSGRVTPSGMVK